jgi:hypothetical protein
MSEFEGWKGIKRRKWERKTREIEERKETEKKVTKKKKEEQEEERYLL